MNNLNFLKPAVTVNYLSINPLKGGHRFHIDQTSTTTKLEGDINLIFLRKTTRQG